MDRHQFWKLIDSAKNESGEDLDRRYEILVKRLAEREPRDIVQFEGIVQELLDEAYRWDLWAAARVMNDGCSDDGFQDFRRWLISSGERAYYGALLDADSLAESAEGERETFFEAFGWVASDAYRKRTGGDIAGDPAWGDHKARVALRREPVGVRWKAEELPKLLPRLCAKYQPEE